MSHTPITIPMVVSADIVTVPMSVSVAEDTIHMTLGASYGAASSYQGEFYFIPSEEQQIARTAGKALGQDITIAPIPSNYGRITQVGAIIHIE